MNKFIQPFYLVENHFLEILITNFLLKRVGKGWELTVSFNFDTPSIWNRNGKNILHKNIPNFEKKSKIYQKELDACLLYNKGEKYRFNDPKFPFRYASGGVLPIIRFGENDYYCLFYREVFPIGWNIANGGCDTRAELLNPLATIEREFFEELIIIDPKNKKRYVFSEDVGKPVDRPEFAVARQFWDEKFRPLGYPDFRDLQELEIPLKWLAGPDSLVIKFGKEPERRILGIFLNINAEDFGIEIDRIAIINLDDDVILCDGELYRNPFGTVLVNAPVGLFQVDRLNHQIEKGITEFIPDIFFFNAQLYKGEDFKNILFKEFLPYIRKICKLNHTEVKQFRKYKKKYNLCPVTQRIIQRYMSLQKARRSSRRKKFDIFICYGGGDEKVAKKVHEFLQKELNKEIFFSKESHDPAFISIINQALESAHLLIAVATNPQNLLRPYPKYEYLCFFNDILCERKPENARLISFISGFEPRYLPKPLCLYEAIKFSPQNFEKGLKNLLQYIRDYWREVG